MPLCRRRVERSLWVPTLFSDTPSDKSEVGYFETELHNKSATRAWAMLVLAGVDHEAFDQKSSDSKSRGE